MTQLLLYLPVLHAGYHRFLERHAHGDVEVLVVGRSFAAEFPVIGKEIRALDPAVALRYVMAAGLVHQGRVVETDEVRSAVRDGVLIMPDEDLMRDLVSRYELDGHAQVEYVTTFLRWDREWSRAGRPPQWEGSCTADEYAREMQRLAATAADRSSDWWRRVGAVAVRDGQVLAMEQNRHLPTSYAPYLDGDPRNNFRRGVEMGLTTAIHAEAAIISRAAREGFSLAGADLHVGTFPCPTCARMIAEVGFARCFFGSGYSVLSGDDVMRAAGVELWYVESAEDALSVGASTA